jgi:hypothetical protein
VLTEVPLRASLLGPAKQGGSKVKTIARPLVRSVPHLLSRPAAELSLADALVFPAERLADPAAARAYGELEPAAGRRVLDISASPLRRRGEDLILVLQPFELAAVERYDLGRSTGRGPFVQVAGLAQGQIASLHVMASRRTPRVVVENGGVEVPCIEVAGRGGFLCSTPRFQAAASVRLRLQSRHRRVFYDVMSWRPAAASATR